MRKILGLLIVLPLTSFAAVTEVDKAANDLCTAEWRILDKAASTDGAISPIINDELKRFYAMGYTLADFGLSENEFVAETLQTTEAYRKDHRPPSPYRYDADTRDTLRELMIPACSRKMQLELNKH